MLRGGGEDWLLDTAAVLGPAAPAGIDDIVNTTTIAYDGSQGADTNSANNTATDTGARFAALAPLSVAPNHQRDGLGMMLMQVGHELCRAAGVQAVIVLGHPDYYPRVGYSAAAAKAVAAPFAGPSFMAMALKPGALDAPVTVTYAKAFGLAQ